MQYILCVCMHVCMHAYIQTWKVVWFEIPLISSHPELINLSSILAPPFPSPLMITFCQEVSPLSTMGVWLYLVSCFFLNYATWLTCCTKSAKKSPKKDTERRPNLRNATTSSLQWRLEVIAMLMHARYRILDGLTSGGWLFWMWTKEKKGRRLIRVTLKQVWYILSKLLIFPV